MTSAIIHPHEQGTEPPSCSLGAAAKMAEHKLDMQVGLLKHLGDVATVLLDLVCLSLFCFFMLFQTDWMMMRSDLCVEHCLLSDSLCKHKSHWIITINGKRNVSH